MAFDLGGGKHKVRPSMNVTPLVDVVLVLLIIFMVITPLMTKQFSVNVPVKDDTQQDEPPPESEPQVVLTVAADGTAYVNKDAIADADLAGKLRRVFAARSDQTLFFDSNDDVEFGRALAVLDIARGAGVNTIAVLTESIVQ